MTTSSAICKSLPSSKKYKAIVFGQMIKKSVKKKNGFYFTEYKLKPKRWIYKNTDVKKSRFLTIRVLGADLPEKGLIIQASTSPSLIPLKKDAVFFLEGTSTKQKDIFTITKGGIIIESNSKVL